MKTTISALIAWGACALTAGAATTINPVNSMAWGANVGWLNWRGDAANGAVIGEYVCSGYVWAANLGWINLGDGTPANGVHYQNNSATDFGVNQDGLGRLRGLAWGANIGWLSFHSLGDPRFDLRTGMFSGFVWGANIGWISLSNGAAHVQTDAIRPGLDVDGDGIADAWERLHFGNLVSANATTDADGDGASDLAEQLADTDPLNPTSNLRITFYEADHGGFPATITWTSRDTRFYNVQKTSEVEPTFWSDAGLGLVAPDPGTTTTRVVTDSPSPERQFFRVRAIRPLSP